MNRPIRPIYSYIKKNSVWGSTKKSINEVKKFDTRANVICEGVACVRLRKIAA